MSGKRSVAAWVLYDGDCSLCTDLAHRFAGVLAGQHFELLPLQTPWVRERLALSERELLAEMRLLLPDGKMFGGADAVLEISRRFWWAWPLSLVGHVPPGRTLLRAGYRWIAQRRSCTNVACAIHADSDKSHRWILNVLPMLILPAAVLVFKTNLAPWIFMWALAGAIFAGCKWLTYRQATSNRTAPNGWRVAAYLFAWPGMDATAFLGNKNITTKPSRSEWLFAILKILLGAILLREVARTAMPRHEMAAGWTGMIGVVFLLHFGLFHILSLVWRSCGMDAVPVMRNPLLAGSLAEFWGKRWNTAFHELAVRFTFRPLRRITTPAAATLLVFLLSGLVHELVISLPAGAGYGLPTAYFLIQGLGVAAERTAIGRRFGFGRGICGWIFTVFVVTAPVFLLFHPPFIHHVILPMLQAIGAT